MAKAPVLPSGHYGWLVNPMEVARIVKDLPIPMIGDQPLSLDENKEVLLYEYVRKVIGGDAPKGPQLIGDCVSWGWANFINYLQVTGILDLLYEQDLLQTFLEEGWEGDSALEDFKNSSAYSYEEVATESTYAFSRCEVGDQWGSNSDGSVGAWAAEAAVKFGHLSRKLLGEYDPKRAKLWGAKGVPDEYEPEARKHTCKVVSMVKSFKEAAACIQAFQTVPVCSDQGFTMGRDSNGFCVARGTWYHCMLFCGVRWNPAGLLCSQSWGANTPSGPRYKDQPDNTFWVSDKTVDRMLSQRDSFTGNSFDHYMNRDYVDLEF